jgi:hypothetical protein
VALRCLLQIQSSCSEMCSIMKQIHESQQHVVHSISGIREALSINDSA